MPATTKNEKRDPRSALEIMRLERTGYVLDRLVGKDAANLMNVLDSTGKLRQNALDDAIENYERDRSNVEPALAAMTKKLPKR